ncbi:hypothetical protein CIB95_00845 [Lottiidibacillus patelloidae]|uniref:Uncharacterized protein n=1 Tax=Lottiidibacillus patelloidae TaxID=2670334 RepID=A0A263BXW9_9BACI|nr:hypothetical protein [Lottiidibacillus patelloidae]OZM58157.1 hypothetical protein CIB95_00845 [Lottiidibacillus patelloidae]
MNYLPLPQQFDQNEWFIIISIILSYTFIYFLPHRFPTSISILVMFFSVFVARVVDELLAGPKVDFYDVIDSGKYELFDIISYMMYAPFAYLLVYFFDKFQLRGLLLFFYIVAFSLFGWGFEWISEHFHLFTYNEWKFSYSLAVYLIIQPITLLFFILISNSHKKCINK